MLILLTIRWGVRSPSLDLGLIRVFRVENVVIRNVRLSDAVKRAELQQMNGDCATGEVAPPSSPPADRIGHASNHFLSCIRS